MAPSSLGRQLMCRVVVLFAFGVLLGHVCALEPAHHHRADASVGIGSAGPDSGGPVAIDDASCENLKPESAWPVMRAIDGQPLPVPGHTVPGLPRVGRAADVPVPRLPLFVLHAALLI
jgi:hypothetical protein